MKFLLIVAVVLGMAGGALAAGKAHRAEAAATNILDVRQYGARGDGTGFDTAAFQKALDAAGAAGGGTVRVPAGTYRLQPIHLRGGVTLQLDEGAFLRASDDPRDYGIGDPALGGRILSIINAKHVNDFGITGRGVIDGSGARWWRIASAARNARLPTVTDRPRLINVAGCRNFTITGVTLQNSPFFHLVCNNCEHVVVRGVTFDSPADSPNTDGVDPADCHDVTISGCRFGTGDDGVAIKAFHVDPAHPNAACSNITVRDCAFVHGHGVAIGSETIGGVSNVLVEHCTFDNTRWTFNIKSGRDRGGVVQDVVLRDIQMHNADPAIQIMGYYPNPPMGDVPRPITATTPIYRRIHIENLTATSPREGAIIIGLPESPITDLTFTNVHLESARGNTVRDARITQN